MNGPEKTIDTVASRIAAGTLIEHPGQAGSQFATPRQAYCASCGRVFTGDAAFEKHRRGPFTARRCETDGLVVRVNSYGTEVWGYAGENPRWK